MIKAWRIGGGALGLFALLFGLAGEAVAVTLGFAGSDLDIGGLYYPGGGPADVQSYVIVPWRSDGVAKTRDIDNNNVYGSAGYAMFATTSTYPNANLVGGEANIPTSGDDLFPNLIDLPTWVVNSEILATRMAGGWAYALVDDPTLVNGYRDYNWGDTQSPPANPAHSQSPYVKIGLLDGGDGIGNGDPKVAPAARWGFEVGADAPPLFRVGVMTDGLDATYFAPIEVTMTHVVGTTIQSVVTSGALAPNRFVDIHTFDVTGAQAGDRFYFSAKATSNPGWASAGISGFTFDVPSSAPLSGDYNGDGSVDAADYTVWRDTSGQNVTPGSGADGTGPSGTPDGLIDSLDYEFWKSNFGGGAGSAALSSVVPEPTAVLLLATGALGLLWSPRRRGPAVA